MSLRPLAFPVLLAALLTADGTHCRGASIRAAHYLLQVSGGFLERGHGVGGILKEVQDNVRGDDLHDFSISMPWEMSYGGWTISGEVSASHSTKSTRSKIAGSDVETVNFFPDLQQTVVFPQPPSFLHPEVQLSVTSTWYLSIKLDRPISLSSLIDQLQFKGVSQTSADCDGLSDSERLWSFGSETLNGVFGLSPTFEFHTYGKKSLAPGNYYLYWESNTSFQLPESAGRYYIPNGKAYWSSTTLAGSITYPIPEPSSFVIAVLCAGFTLPRLPRPIQKSVNAA